MAQNKLMTERRRLDTRYTPGKNKQNEKKKFYSKITFANSATIIFWIEEVDEKQNN